MFEILIIVAVIALVCVFYLLVNRYCEYRPDDRYLALRDRYKTIVRYMYSGDNEKMSPRTCIYIAGPISKGVLADNVNQATDAFIRLAKAGFSPFCPHWSVYAKYCGSMSHDQVYCVGTITGNPSLTHDDWINVDLSWVERSDVVLRLPGESVGADREVEHAQKHGLIVYTDINQLIEDLS